MSSIGCYWTFPVGAEQPGVLEADGPSLISHIKQLSLALALGGLDMEKVKLVCTNLERGADIGCKGPARGESYSSNAASCELGQITHAIGGWLEKGFAVGPF